MSLKELMNPAGAWYDLPEDATYHDGDSRDLTNQAKGAPGTNRYARLSAREVDNPHKHTEAQVGGYEARDAMQRLMQGGQERTAAGHTVSGSPRTLVEGRTADGRDAADEMVRMGWANPSLNYDYQGLSAKATAIADFHSGNPQQPGNQFYGSDEGQQKMLGGVRLAQQQRPLSDRRTALDASNNTVLQDLGAGFRRSGQLMKESTGGLVEGIGQVAKNVGLDSVGQGISQYGHEMSDNARHKMATNIDYQKSINSTGEIHGAGDLAHYIAGMAGEVGGQAIPAIASMVLPGGAPLKALQLASGAVKAAEIGGSAAEIAAAKLVAEQAAKKLGAQQLARGYAVNAPQLVGENMASVAHEYNDKTGQFDNNLGGNLISTGVTGLAAAALDTASLHNITKAFNFKVGDKLLQKAGKAVGSIAMASGIEGGTEAAQKVLEETNLSFISPDHLFAPKGLWNMVKEDFYGGMAGGGVMHAVSGTGHAVMDAIRGEEQSEFQEHLKSQQQRSAKGKASFVEKSASDILGVTTGIGGNMEGPLRTMRMQLQDGSPYNFVRGPHDPGNIGQTAAAVVGAHYDDFLGKLNPAHMAKITKYADEAASTAPQVNPETGLDPYGQVPQKSFIAGLMARVLEKHMPDSAEKFSQLVSIAAESGLNSGSGFKKSSIPWQTTAEKEAASLQITAVRPRNMNEENLRQSLSGIMVGMVDVSPVANAEGADKYLNDLGKLSVNSSDEKSFADRDDMLFQKLYGLPGDADLQFVNTYGQLSNPALRNVPQDAPVIEGIKYLIGMGIRKGVSYGAGIDLWTTLPGILSAYPNGTGASPKQESEEVAHWHQSVNQLRRVFDAIPAQYDGLGDITAPSGKEVFDLVNRLIQDHYNPDPQAVQRKGPSALVDQLTLGESGGSELFNDSDDSDVIEQTSLTPQQLLEQHVAPRDPDESLGLGRRFVSLLSNIVDKVHGTVPNYKLKPSENEEIDEATGRIKEDRYKDPETGTWAMYPDDHVRTTATDFNPLYRVFSEVEPIRNAALGLDTYDVSGVHGVNFHKHDGVVELEVKDTSYNSDVKLFGTEAEAQRAIDEAPKVDHRAFDKEAPNSNPLLQGVAPAYDRSSSREDPTAGYEGGVAEYRVVAVMDGDKVLGYTAVKSLDPDTKANMELHRDLEKNFLWQAAMGKKREGVTVKAGKTEPGIDPSGKWGRENAWAIFDPNWAARAASRFNKYSKHASDSPVGTAPEAGIRYLGAQQLVEMGRKMLTQSQTNLVGRAKDLAGALHVLGSILEAGYSLPGGVKNIRNSQEVLPAEKGHGSVTWGDLHASDRLMADNVEFNRSFYDGGAARSAMAAIVSEAAAVRQEQVELAEQLRSVDSLPVSLQEAHRKSIEAKQIELVDTFIRGKGDTKNSRAEQIVRGEILKNPESAFNSDQYLTRAHSDFFSGHLDEKAREKAVFELKKEAATVRDGAESMTTEEIVASESAQAFLSGSRSNAERGVRMGLLKGFNPMSTKTVHVVTVAKQGMTGPIASEIMSKMDENADDQQYGDRSVSPMAKMRMGDLVRNGNVIVTAADYASADPAVQARVADAMAEDTKAYNEELSAWNKSEEAKSHAFLMQEGDLVRDGKIIVSAEDWRSTDEDTKQEVARKLEDDDRTYQAEHDAWEANPVGAEPQERTQATAEMARAVTNAPQLSLKPKAAEFVDEDMYDTALASAAATAESFHDHNAKRLLRDPDDIATPVLETGTGAKTSIYDPINKEWFPIEGTTNSGVNAGAKTAEGAGLGQGAKVVDPSAKKQARLDAIEREAESVADDPGASGVRSQLSEKHRRDEVMSKQVTDADLRDLDISKASDNDAVEYKKLLDKYEAAIAAREELIEDADKTGMLRMAVGTSVKGSKVKAEITTKKGSEPKTISNVATVLNYPGKVEADEAVAGARGKLVTLFEILRPLRKGEAPQARVTSKGDTPYPADRSEHKATEHAGNVSESLREYTNEELTIAAYLLDIYFDTPKRTGPRRSSESLVTDSWATRDSRLGDLSRSSEEAHAFMTYLAHIVDPSGLTVVGSKDTVTGWLKAAVQKRVMDNAFMDKHSSLMSVLESKMPRTDKLNKVIRKFALDPTGKAAGTRSEKLAIIQTAFNEVNKMFNEVYVDDIKPGHRFDVENVEIPQEALKIARSGKIDLNSVALLEDAYRDMGFQPRGHNAKFIAEKIKAIAFMQYVAKRATAALDAGQFTIKQGPDARERFDAIEGEIKRRLWLITSHVEHNGVHTYRVAANGAKPESEGKEVATEAPKTEAPKTEAPKTEAPKTEVPAVTPAATVVSTDEPNSPTEAQNEDTEAAKADIVITAAQWQPIKGRSPKNWRNTFVEAIKSWAEKGGVYRGVLSMYPKYSPEFVFKIPRGTMTKVDGNAAPRMGFYSVRTGNIHILEGAGSDSRGHSGDYATILAHELGHAIDMQRAEGRISDNMTAEQINALADVIWGGDHKKGVESGRWLTPTEMVAEFNALLHVPGIFESLLEGQQKILAPIKQLLEMGRETVSVKAILGADFNHTLPEGAVITSSRAAGAKGVDIVAYGLVSSEMMIGDESIAKMYKNFTETHPGEGGGYTPAQRERLFSLYQYYLGNHLDIVDALFKSMESSGQYQLIDTPIPTGSKGRMAAAGNSKIVAAILNAAAKNNKGLKELGFDEFDEVYEQGESDHENIQGSDPKVEAQNYIRGLVTRIGSLDPGSAELGTAINNYNDWVDYYKQEFGEEPKIAGVKADIAAEATRRIKESGTKQQGTKQQGTKQQGTKSQSAEDKARADQEALDRIRQEWDEQDYSAPTDKMDQKEADARKYLFGLRKSIFDRKLDKGSAEYKEAWEAFNEAKAKFSEDFPGKFFETKAEEKARLDLDARLKVAAEKRAQEDAQKAADKAAGGRLTSDSWTRIVEEARKKYPAFSFFVDHTTVTSDRAVLKEGQITLYYKGLKTVNDLLDAIDHEVTGHGASRFAFGTADTTGFENFVNKLWAENFKGFEDEQNFVDGAYEATEKPDELLAALVGKAAKLRETEGYVVPSMAGALAGVKGSLTERKVLDFLNASRQLALSKYMGGDYKGAGIVEDYVQGISSLMSKAGKWAVLRIRGLYYGDKLVNGIQALGKSAWSFASPFFQNLDDRLRDMGAHDIADKFHHVMGSVGHDKRQTVPEMEAAERRIDTQGENGLNKLADFIPSKINKLLMSTSDKAYNVQREKVLREVSTAFYEDRAPSGIKVGDVSAVQIHEAVSKFLENMNTRWATVFPNLVEEKKTSSLPVYVDVDLWSANKDKIIEILQDKGGLSFDKAEKLWEDKSIAVTLTEVSSEEPMTASFGSWYDIPKDARPALSEFFNHDIAGSLLSYLNAGTKRGTYDHFFGEMVPKKSGPGLIFDATYHLRKARDEMSSAADKSTFTTKILPALMGTLGSRMSPELRAINAWGTVFLNTLLLPLSITSQFVDLGGVAIRDEHAGRVFKTLAKYMYDKDFRRRITAEAEIAIPSLHRAAAEMLSQEHLGTVSAAAKINAKFFELNLMQSWSKMSRILGYTLGTQAFRRYAEEAKSKDPAIKQRGLSDLAEYGLSVADVDAWDGKPNGQFAVAINHWVNSAVLKPGAPIRPVWMSDASKALFAYLHSFTSATHAIFGARLVHNMARRTGGMRMAPMLIAGGTMLPLVLAGMSLRAMVSNAGGDDDKLKKEHNLFGDFMRTGLGGLLAQSLWDMHQSEEHGGGMLPSLFVATSVVEQMLGTISIDKESGLPTWDVQRFIGHNTPVLSKFKAYEKAWGSSKKSDL